MSELIENQENVLSAKDRIKYIDIKDFYELGNPEDWKELIKYSKFYFAEEDEERRDMISTLLKPVLLRRFKEVDSENLGEILRKVANLSTTEKEELKLIIQRREEEINKKFKEEKVAA